jgi:hypothetical protein
LRRADRYAAFDRIRADSTTVSSVWPDAHAHANADAARDCNGDGYADNCGDRNANLNATGARIIW